MKTAGNSLLEQEKIQQLAKFRRIATSLLLLMAVVFIATKRYELAYPSLAYVRAFAEAAMVGALADWFAVTALFKHPLGLPIPHTAIIRKNKDRIGASIANFLEHNFMTHDVIQEELREVNFAEALTSWLTVPGNSQRLAQRLASTLPAFVNMVQDKNVGQFLQQRFGAVMGTVHFAPMLGDLISLLKGGGQHQQVFDHVITLAADALERNRPYIRQKIHDKSPRWLPKSIDEKLFLRLVEELHNILQEMREEDSEWRTRFEDIFEEFIEKLKTSPEYESRLNSMLREALSQEVFRTYLTKIWQDLKMRLLQDIAADDSHIVARLEQALIALARALKEDRAVSDKLNHWLREFATLTIVHRRGDIAQLVEKVIRKWDGETIAHKIELHVGKDLQYIRINGTLVGGMVGLALHLFSKVLA